MSQMSWTNKLYVWVLICDKFVFVLTSVLHAPFQYTCQSRRIIRNQISVSLTWIPFRNYWITDNVILVWLKVKSIIRFALSIISTSHYNAYILDQFEKGQLESIHHLYSSLLPIFMKIIKLYIEVFQWSRGT